MYDSDHAFVIIGSRPPQYEYAHNPRNTPRYYRYIFGNHSYFNCVYGTIFSNNDSLRDKY